MEKWIKTWLSVCFLGGYSRLAKRAVGLWHCNRYGKNRECTKSTCFYTLELGMKRSTKLIESTFIKMYLVGWPRLSLRYNAAGTKHTMDHLVTTPTPLRALPFVAR